MVPSLLTWMLCRVIVLRRGDSALHLAPLPAGTCALCCPIDLDRDVEFQLYTRRNPAVPSMLRLRDPATLRTSNFDGKNPTVVYIHGYSESAPGLSGATIRNAYLGRGDYNVILVDWSKLSSLPWYANAVRNTRVVGRHVASLVSWLDALKAVPVANVHVVGFSLGAEAAGFVGKSLAPRKIGRITGLDAAYPLYMNTGAEGHLTAADARFVDVIHTDGGKLGFPYPLGHADYYPNGGRALQPGCSLRSVVHDGFSRLIRQYITCGHHRAWRFYAESVKNPYGFPASRCPKWRPDINAPCSWSADAYMGFAASPNKRGMFYLRTNARPPYGLNNTSYKFG